MQNNCHDDNTKLFYHAQTINIYLCHLYNIIKKKNDAKFEITNK